MSILLTDYEVAAIGQELAAANNVSDLYFARAIQLALIEKLRKEPDYYEFADGEIVRDRDMIHMAHKTGMVVVSLYRLPTPQELEES